MLCGRRARAFALLCKHLRASVRQAGGIAVWSFTADPWHDFDGLDIHVLFCETYFHLCEMYVGAFQCFYDYIHVYIFPTQKEYGTRKTQVAQKRHDHEFDCNGSPNMNSKKYWCRKLRGEVVK
jgi:hypothetical protein